MVARIHTHTRAYQSRSHTLACNTFKFNLYSLLTRFFLYWSRAELNLFFLFIAIFVERRVPCNRPSSIPSELTLPHSLQLLLHMQSEKYIINLYAIWRCLCILSTSRRTTIETSRNASEREQCKWKKMRKNIIFNQMSAAFLCES